MKDIAAFSEIQNHYSFHLLSFSQTPKSLALNGRGVGVFLTIQLSTIMQMKKVGNTTPMLSVPSLNHEMVFMTIHESPVDQLEKTAVKEILSS